MMPQSNNWSLPTNQRSNIGMSHVKASAVRICLLNLWHDDSSETKQSSSIFIHQQIVCDKCKRNDDQKICHPCRNFMNLIISVIKPHFLWCHILNLSLCISMVNIFEQKLILMLYYPLGSRTSYHTWELLMLVVAEFFMLVSVTL